MKGSPRFVLVAGALASGARRLAWPGRSELVGEPSATGHWVAWRLLGRNNHELGRSPRVFPTADAAVADVTELCRVALEGTMAVLADGAQAEWRWRFLVDRDVRAVSSRSYLRQRECHYNAATFRSALGSACVPAVVVGPEGSLL